MRPSASSVVTRAVTIALGVIGISAQGWAGESPEAEPAVERPEPVRVYRKDNKTVFESADALVALSNRIQFRFTQEDPDPRTRLPGTLEPGDSRGSFRIRRAKTRLEGWVWRKELMFELAVGWAGADSGNSASTFSGLEDARVIWDASGNGRFRVTFGQFKVPFGRQELTSSEALQFCDRSILSGEFTFSRDAGVTVGGRLAAGRVRYDAGIFNGNGRNKPNNDNGKYQYDARVAFEPLGAVLDVEGDPDHSPKPVLSLGLDMEDNSQFGATNANDLATRTLGADVVLKYRGFAAMAEYFSRRRTPEQGAQFHANGYHLQAGYYVVKDKLELAFRYASFDPTDVVPDDDHRELGGAVSYVVRKGVLRLQADLRRLEDLAQRTRDSELRVQSNFSF